MLLRMVCLKFSQQMPNACWAKVKQKLDKVFIDKQFPDFFRTKETSCGNQANFNLIQT